MRPICHACLTPRKSWLCCPTCHVDLMLAGELQPLAVARLLAAIAKKEAGVGLLMLGKQAIDDDSNQTVRFKQLRTPVPAHTCTCAYRCTLCRCMCTCTSVYLYLSCCFCIMTSTGIAMVGTWRDVCVDSQLSQQPFAKIVCFARLSPFAVECMCVLLQCFLFITPLSSLLVVADCHTSMLDGAPHH